MARHITVPFLDAGIVIFGSGTGRVMLWKGFGPTFRMVKIHSPVNLSLHSWRYAIRRLGLSRAILSRGFVRPR